VVKLQVTLFFIATLQWANLLIREAGAIVGLSIRSYTLIMLFGCRNTRNLLQPGAH